MPLAAPAPVGRLHTDPSLAITSPEHLPVLHFPAIIHGPEAWQTTPAHRSTGAGVGFCVAGRGVGVGLSDGASLGFGDGTFVGLGDGASVGLGDGAKVGDIFVTEPTVGINVGTDDGWLEGAGTG